MRTRFLLGPAGSGKTFRCLAEIRAALAGSPDDPPLLLIAPKQATFQLERQLLADPTLSGYMRLRILSFERLAEFVIEELHRPPGRLLNDEGRVMVLRALLERHEDDLKLFHSTARLPGFSRQLSILLRELQQFHVGHSKLDRLADKVGSGQRLDHKLRDLALIERAYSQWLKEHDLEDAGGLLAIAAEELRAHPESKVQIPKSLESSGQREAALTQATFDSINFGLESDFSLTVGALWLDGFAEMTAQEISLLAALIPHCETATLAFCLERQPTEEPSWLSTWSVVAQTFRNCHSAVAAVANCDITVEVLDRDSEQGRFAGNPALAHLERNWTTAAPFNSGLIEFTGAGADACATPADQFPIRIIHCESPHAEAVFAAREILRAVRDHGLRYRDIAVLLRSIESHADLLRRAFARYQIPCFLDRRESAAHHPLAELTRSALRTVAFNWQREDWFSALKSGFAPLGDDDLDWLENEALARGWTGGKWRKPIVIPDQPDLAKQLEGFRASVMPPFEKLFDSLAVQHFKLNGAGLSAAIRELWADLRVDETLAQWAGELSDAAQMHQTVREQMQSWLENLERAFSGDVMSLNDWLLILEAGLSSLTVGVVPPSLDQVLIGSIDRSRNPDLQLVILPGMNEGVFPAAPREPVLLTEQDREELSRHGVDLGLTRRQQIGHERYYGYIACTRARSNLILSWAERDSDDQPLNASSFIPYLRRMFPDLDIEKFRPQSVLEEFVHVSEVAAPLLGEESSSMREALSFVELPEEFARLRHYQPSVDLKPDLAEALYGPTLHTSVSRIEQFAACPFRFFVASGLKADERERFEVDARHLGSLQHEVLQRFHEQLASERLRWRDITPGEGERRIVAIAEDLGSRYGNGLFGASARSRFQAASLTRSLCRFIRSAIQWMTTYQFDPLKVELSFGNTDSVLPAWELDLGEGHALAFRGVIDRVDLAVNRDSASARCVVIDYKSSLRKIDPVLLDNGIQIQLPAYLAVLHQLKDSKSVLGVKELIPCGLFYVNLRGRFSSAKTRLESITTENGAAGDSAYQHEGRFDLEALGQLDVQGAATGEKSGQFNFRLTVKGEPYKNSPSIMRPEEFRLLLDQTEEHLRRMGAAIYRGDIRVDPYLKDGKTPCEWCDYASICRIDPWSHRYRVLLQRGETNTDL